LSNLAKFAPLLRKTPIPSEAKPTQQRKEKPISASSSEYAEADKLFKGKSLRTELQLKKPTLKRTPAATRRRRATPVPKPAVQISEKIRRLGLNSEQGFHYPQGVHIGHLLAIIKAFGKGQRRLREFHTDYIRLSGGLGGGRISAYRRQLKYILMASVGFGLASPTAEGDDLELTAKGEELRKALADLLADLDLRFRAAGKGVPSTRMALSPKDYNRRVNEFLSGHAEAHRLFLEIFLNVPAVRQMLSYLQALNISNIPKYKIYAQFFRTRLVRKYCAEQAIPTPTQSGAEHRLPFLLNILETCGFLRIENGDIAVSKP